MEDYTLKASTVFLITTVPLTGKEFQTALPPPPPPASKASQSTDRRGWGGGGGRRKEGGDEVELEDVDSSNYGKRWEELEH